MKVDLYSRKGFSPPVEPTPAEKRHIVPEGEARGWRILQSTLADIPSPVAHKVAASREVLLGTEDLPKYMTATFEQHDRLNSRQVTAGALHCDIANRPNRETRQAIN